MSTASLAELPRRVGAAQGAGVRITPAVGWTLCALTFAIPLEFPDRFLFEVTTMLGALFLLSTLLQPRVCYGYLPWAVTWYGLYLTVLMVALMTHGVAYPGGLNLPQVKKLMLLLVLWVLSFWACSNLLRQERLARAVLWSLILGCLVRAALPLAGVARTAQLQGIGGERVTAFGQNPNQSAQVLALGLLALVGLVYVQSRGGLRPRFLAWMGVGLLTVGLVQTGSRGGLVVVAIGLLVVLATGQRLRVRIRNATVALLGLGVLAFAVGRSDLMRRRIDLAVEEGRLAQREKIFPQLLGMIREKPLLGWGPTTNKSELVIRTGEVLTHGGRDAHNLILEVLTAGGFLGAIPFFIGIWLCLRSAWRARAGPRGVVPLAMLLALLAGNMSENRVAGPLLWLVLAYALSSGAATQVKAPLGAIPSRPRGAAW